MLLDGEPVGHAGDIVAHHAGAPGRLEVLQAAVPLRRQDVGFFQEQGEHLGQNTARLAARAIDLPVAVHPLVQERPKPREPLDHVVRKGHQGDVQHPHVLGVLDPGGDHPPRRFRHHVFHHLADHPANRLQAGQAVVDVRIVLAHASQHGADQRHVHQVGQGEQPRLHAIVDVVVVVGDVIGQGGHLRFGRGPGVQAQRVLGVIVRHPLPRRPRQFVGHRPVVLDHPLQGLPGQVQADEGGIAALQHRHHPEGLGVVVKAAPRRHLPFQLVLAGVAERRMAQVVRQSHGLGQVRIQLQRRGHRAGDLRHLQRVGQAGAVVVALVRHEHLGLFLQAAKSGGVDDAVAVAGEGRARGALGAAKAPALGVGGVFGIGGAARHLVVRGHPPPVPFAFAPLRGAVVTSYKEPRVIISP